MSRLTITCDICGNAVWFRRMLQLRARYVNYFRNVVGHNAVDKREFTAILQNPESATHRLLMMWRNVPLLLMLDVDWDRGPLVLIGAADGMMWPLLPPGSLLQLDQRVRSISEGTFSESERPIYLIEYRNRFFCCHAQRRGDTLRMISHRESQWPPAIPIPFKEARVRGRVTPIFRPLANRENARSQYYR